MDHAAKLSDRAAPAAEPKSPLQAAKPCASRFAEGSQASAVSPERPDASRLALDHLIIVDLTRRRLQRVISTKDSLQSICE